MPPSGATGPSGSSAFCAGAVVNFVTKFTSTSEICNSIIFDNGTNVGISTTAPVSKLNVVGKTTLSRDSVAECCGNDATLALAELTTGAGASGRVSSISFHNGNSYQGQLSLVADNTGLGLAEGRLRLSSGGLSGGNLGLQVVGGVYYGNRDSRSETRANAGTQGSAGAQSGFFEFNQASGTSQSINYPAGYSGNTWWHLIDSRHSNPANNFAMQFSGNFFDQKTFVRKTNNSASTAWNRFVNSADAAASSGYLMNDFSGFNGTQEGTVVVALSATGVLTITMFNEAGTNLGVSYTLNGVANAKVMIHISNDDTGNCGTAKVSLNRITPNLTLGTTNTQSTDMGCTNSDGNNHTYFIAFNPL